MNIYKIWIENYEEHQEIDLCHEEKFSEEQLEEMINDCLVDLRIQTLNEDFINICCLKHDDIFERSFNRKTKKFTDIGDILCKKYGFQTLNYNEIVYTIGSCWGTGSNERYQKAFKKVNNATMEYLKQNPDIECDGHKNIQNCGNYFNHRKMTTKDLERRREVCYYKD